MNKFIFLQLICDIVVFIQQILHTLVNNGIEFRKRTKFYDYNPMVGFKASEIHHFFLDLYSSACIESWIDICVYIFSKL